MRVLHLVTRSQGRGAERVALQLAAALRGPTDEHDVVAIAAAFDGSTIDGIEPLIDSRKIGAATVLWAAIRLRRRIRTAPTHCNRQSLAHKSGPHKSGPHKSGPHKSARTGSATVLLAHGGTAAAVACIATLGRSRSNRPTMVWQRILPFPASLQHGWRRRMWSAVARRADLIVALTDDIASETTAICATANVVVISNFRDPAPFVNLDRNAAGTALRDRIGATPNVTLIGLVGHLIDQKQPVHAVEALAMLRAVARPSGERPASAKQIELVVVGDGPSTASIEAAIARHGLERFVHCLGPLDDVGPTLAGLDLLVLTSATEGVPGVVIEGLMCGCPTVSYPVGGVASVIRSGVDGLIVDTATPKAIAAAVSSLVEDHEALAAMSRAARIGSARFDIATARDAYTQYMLAVSRHP